MASSTRHVVLNASRDIPFDKLVPSQGNVRQVKAGLGIEELSDDIARRGLIQSLGVRPVRDGEGRETGFYEVPAGGRRYRALERLVRAKRLTKTAPVPCVVQANDTHAEEDSLAENVQRVSPHSLDQFRAFRTLRDERGLSEEEIAAVFFVTPAVVRQRLKLAAVSPKLLDAYAEDAMSLDQLMAFAVSGDHARQEGVWGAIQRGSNKEACLIRRMLTEGKVRACDRRAVFVGPEAYQAAGGTIARDLFHADAGGWFEDVALLERLVDEGLQAEASAVVAEGWKWVEVARDFPWGHTQGMRRVFATLEPTDDADEERLTALREEMEGIEAEYAGTGEDLPEEVDGRLARLEAEIEGLEERPGAYDPAAVAMAGAYVSLSHEGRIRIERGYVRAQDEPRIAAETEVGGSARPADRSAIAPGAAVPVTGAAPGANGSGASSPEEDEGDARQPLSERLVTELTAFRTLALREALANDPDVAGLAVLHALALRAFYGQQGYDPGSCLEIEARSAAMPVGSGVPLSETGAARALARMHEAWGAGLPRKAGALWDWLVDRDADTRASLLAYCAARSLDATHRPHERRPSALAHANRVAEALALDLSEHWSATRANYLGRVTRAQISSAVSEARGEAAAAALDHLKTGDMACEAERLLAGTGWLPALLRTPGLADGAAADRPAAEGFGADADHGSADGAGPAVRDPDLDGEPEAGDDPAYGVAAEQASPP